MHRAAGRKTPLADSRLQPLVPAGISHDPLLVSDHPPTALAAPAWEHIVPGAEASAVLFNDDGDVISAGYVGDTVPYDMVVMRQSGIDGAEKWRGGTDHSRLGAVTREEGASVRRNASFRTLGG